MLLDVVSLSGGAQVELGLPDFTIVFGEDDTLHDFVDDVQIAVNKNEVDFVHLFDVFGEVAALLVDHLPRGHHFGLVGRALLLLLVQRRKVFVRQDLLVEGDRVFVGLVHGGDGG